MTPAEMAALMARAYPDGRGWSDAEFAELAARPGAIVTCDAHTVVLGQVIAGDAEVFMVLTDPDQRRRGLARAAMKAFHTAAQVAEATRVILEVAADNAPARALYHGLGYAQIAERKAYYARPTGPAVSALILEKRL